jgi:hypothetical protein
MNIGEMLRRKDPKADYLAARDKYERKVQDIIIRMDPEYGHLWAMIPIDLLELAFNGEWSPLRLAHECLKRTGFSR